MHDVCCIYLGLNDVVKQLMNPHLLGKQYHYEFKLDNYLVYWILHCQKIDKLEMIVRYLELDMIFPSFAKQWLDYVFKVRSLLIFVKGKQQKRFKLATSQCVPDVSSETVTVFMNIQETNVGVGISSLSLLMKNSNNRVQYGRAIIPCKSHRY